MTGRRVFQIDEDPSCFFVIWPDGQLSIQCVCGTEEVVPHRDDETMLTVRDRFRESHSHVVTA